MYRVKRKWRSIRYCVGKPSLLSLATFVRINSKSFELHRHSILVNCMYVNRYYMNGCCIEGDDCLFSHNWNSKPDMVWFLLAPVGRTNEQILCVFCRCAVTTSRVVVLTEQTVATIMLNRLMLHLHHQSESFCQPVVYLLQ